MSTDSLLIMMSFVSGGSLVAVVGLVAAILFLLRRPLIAVPVRHKRSDTKFETVILQVPNKRDDIERMISRMGRIGFSFSANIDTYGRTVGLVFQRIRRVRRETIWDAPAAYPVFWSA